MKLEKIITFLLQTFLAVQRKFGHLGLAKGGLETEALLLLMVWFRGTCFLRVKHWSLTASLKVRTLTLISQLTPVILYPTSNIMCK